jgi:hypothetical protein
MTGLRAHGSCWLTAFIAHNFSAVFSRLHSRFCPFFYPPSRPALFRFFPNSFRLLSANFTLFFPTSFTIPPFLLSAFSPGSFQVLSKFLPVAFHFARNDRANRTARGVQPTRPLTAESTATHGRKALLHAGFDAPAPLAPMIQQKPAGVFEHNDLSIASVFYSKSPQNSLSNFIENPLSRTINTRQIPIDTP